jgi:hypothetical protein
VQKGLLLMNNNMDRKKICQAERRRSLIFLATSYGLGLLWQQLNGNVSYWGLAWDSSLWEPLANDWNTWLKQTAPVFANTLLIIGLVLSGFFVVLFVKKWDKALLKKLSCFSAWSLSVFLFLFMLWGWKDHNWLWPWMAEHSLRILLPLLLFYWLYGDERQQKVITRTAVVALSLTFLGHGWFAMNLAPIPGDFLYMSTRILQIDEPAARHFLLIMGVLDLIAVVCFWIKKLRRPALWYAVAWGLLTALARLVGHWYVDMPMESINEWLPEVLVRLGHGLVPLILLLRKGI